MCPDESQLIRLIAGELDESGRRRLRAHLETCADCRRAADQLGQTWATLDQWRPEPPPIDLTAAILARASRPETSTGRLRLAAMLLLAIGAGVVAGVVAPVPAPRAYASATDEQVVAHLALDEWAADPPLVAALSTTDSGIGPLEIAPPERPGEP